MYGLNLRPPSYTHINNVRIRIANSLFQLLSFWKVKKNHGGAISAKKISLMWYGFIFLLCSHVIRFQQPHQTYLAK